MASLIAKTSLDSLLQTNFRTGGPLESKEARIGIWGCRKMPAKHISVKRGLNEGAKLSHGCTLGRIGKCPRCRDVRNARVWKGSNKCRQDVVAGLSAKRWDLIVRPGC